MPQPTLNIKDRDGNLKTVFTQNPNGQAADADSQPVSLSVEQFGTVGASAPTNPSGGTGFIGWLTGISKTLLAIAAILPSSLGQKTMAQSPTVNIASDQSAIPMVMQQITNQGLTISANTVQITTTGYSSLKVILASNAGTVNVQGSEDGTTFFNLNMVAAGGGPNTSALVGTGEWEAEVGALQFVTFSSATTAGGRYGLSAGSSVVTVDNIPIGPGLPSNGQLVTIANKVTIAGSNATTGASTTLDLITGAANGWVDVSNYQTASFTVITDGTHATGAITFEQTDDTTFTAATAPGLFVYQDTSLVASPITTTGALGANVTNKYSCPIVAKFIRARLSAAPTAGNIRITSAFSQMPWNRPVFNVRLSDGANQSPTGDAANRKFFVQLTDGTSSVTAKAASTAAAIADLGIVASLSPNIFAPISVADIASAALTTTTTTATITPTGGTCYEINIPVTAVTGTTPTLDVGVEESDDGGTNWFRVYDFPRITAVGMYRSPKLPFTGNRVRYVQTVGGTTPSFTRSLNRLQQYDTAAPLRQIIDRTIVLTTLNSTTPTLNIQGCRNVQLVLNLGAATTPPAIQLEGSDDNGATWYALGSPLTGVASSTVQVTVNNVQAAQLRARVSTIGATVTAGYTLIKGF